MKAGVADTRELPFFLFILLALALGGCSSSMPVYRSKPVEERRPPGPEPVVGRSQILSAIQPFLGSPYRSGGESTSGVDCSGLVVAVYRQSVNIKLPHSARRLARVGVHVDRENLVLGDLVFFQTGWSRFSHVGIYLEEDRFVHASHSNGVIVSELEDPYYRARYTGARRVIR